MYPFKYHDGGRSASFDTPGVNDCVTRALAILTELPYLDIWNGLQATGTVGRTGLVACYDWRFKKYAHSLGLNYVRLDIPMRNASLPKRAAVEIRGHLFAVINGVMYDTGNHSKSGRTIVKGYWEIKPVQIAMYNVHSVITGKPLNIAPLNYDQAVTMARLMMLNYKKETIIKPYGNNSETTINAV